MLQYSKYVGLDVHKDSIVIGVAERSGEPPQFHGRIANTPEAVKRLVKKLSPHGEVVAFCYEAGPCGYGIYRQDR